MATRPQSRFEPALVGRDLELRHLLDVCRVHRRVALVGLPGAGKSRLAQAAAALEPSIDLDGTGFTPGRCTLSTHRVAPHREASAAVTLEGLVPDAAAALLRAAAQRAGCCHTLEDDTVAALCVELDGLPGPILYAGAVCATLGPDALLALLRGGAALEGVLPSERRATFVWTAQTFAPYLRALLPRDAALLLRLTVFERRFSLAAASALNGGKSTLAALARLVETGVLRIEGTQEIAYTLGRYARRALAALDPTGQERAFAEARLERHCLALAERGKSLGAEIAPEDLWRLVERQNAPSHFAHTVACAPHSGLVSDDPGRARRLFERLLATQEWRDAERLALVNALCDALAALGATNALGWAVVEGLALARQLGDRRGEAALLARRTPEPEPAIPAATVFALALEPLDLELARGLVRGETNTDLARRCGVSANVVRHRLSALYRRHGCRTRSELVRRLLGNT
jgi:DNA-binding CsgD family transcriptional regulator